MAVDAEGSARSAVSSSDSEPFGTVARVDLPSGESAHAAGSPAKVLESALRRVQQTVRADDRVCPLGLSRIAITFGPDAEAVTTRILGERLARAVAFGLASEANKSHESPGVKSNARRRDLTTNGNSDLHGVDVGRTTAVVTVDRLTSCGSGPAAPTAIAATEQAPVPVGAPLFRHRTVVRYPPSRSPGGARHDDHPTGSRSAESSGTILVVDPTPSTPGKPGLAAQAAVATSERLGFRADAVAPLSHEVLDLTFQTGGLDLVVLVVGSEPAVDVPLWSHSSWCRPAQLAAGCAALGVDVLAVSAGAGAGALTACYDQGATILFDLDQLPSELQLWRRCRESSRSAPESATSRMPTRFQALLQLTASERRVLFYLTTGLSAQQIADNLVVSLTTVRSHIRSILRKLGVRSQLAAVVYANSRDLGRIEPSTLPAELAPFSSGSSRRRTG